MRIFSKKTFLFCASLLFALFVACSADGGTETVTVTKTETVTVEVEQPATYSVVFLPNGADGAVTTQSFKVGTAQNLTVNAFTRTGYTFAGWNTKSDGSDTAYQDGTSVTGLASENGSAFLLYGQWKENNSSAPSAPPTSSTGAISAEAPSYSDTLEITAKVSGTAVVAVKKGETVTFSVAANYTAYTWFIDDEIQSTGTNKAEWSLDTSGKSAKNYFVLVLATDSNGKTLSATYELAITK